METVWHMQERQAGRQAGGRAQMLDRIGRAHTPKFFLLPPVVSNSVRERKTLALAEREERDQRSVRLLFRTSRQRGRRRRMRGERRKKKEVERSYREKRKRIDNIVEREREKGKSP